MDYADLVRYSRICDELEDTSTRTHPWRRGRAPAGTNCVCHAQHQEERLLESRCCRRPGSFTCNCPLQHLLLSAEMTATASLALSELTPAQKKARRQHLKTTKNRPTDIGEGWTPFRTAEKQFKAKWPPPDMSSVLDVRPEATECISGGGGGASRGECRDIVDWRHVDVSVNEMGKGKAYVFLRVPGMRDHFVSHMYILITYILCNRMTYDSQASFTCLDL